MRVVLATYGSRGDVEPMTGLALRLQAQGAEVVLCAPPDFAELLDRIGIAFTPLGWPIQALATGAVTGKAPKTLEDITLDLTTMAYESVTSAAQGASMIVATGSLPAAAGALAASEKLGLRYLKATFSPSYLPSAHFPPSPWHNQVVPEGVTGNLELWRLQAEHLQSMLGGFINTHRVSIGLPPTDNIRDHVFTDHPLLAADPVLGPREPSEGLDVIQTGAWIRPDDRPLPADLEAFLAAGTPPVYVGFGSMPLREAEKIGPAVVEAVRAQGRRVLLGSGWAELALTDDADDGFVIGETNQQALFPRVAAVVHHGGAGAPTTTARAGVPQVIVPQVADQPYWGDRVAALGIGTRHDGPTPTAESLSAALKIALEPDVAARAAEVAGMVSGDGAERTAKMLIGLVSDTTH